MNESPEAATEQESVNLLRARLLWKERRWLCRVAAVCLLGSIGFSCALPKRYTASAAIMPPDQSSSSAMMLAAIAGHASGLSALSGLASGLIGLRSSTDVFVGLLNSGTVSGALIQRFDLRSVYHVRYNQQAAKRLAHDTKITGDKKSGLITISVEDTDPARARDMAQTYLDELNKLVNRTATAQARQERIFIETRLSSVGRDLSQAQVLLSEYASRNGTIDIKEQTRALVDAGARVQAELFVERSSLQSVKQIYGDDNVRVRQSEARISSLQRSLSHVANSDGDGTGPPSVDNTLSPPLRQLPRLAVPYADLYRKVRIQETIYELLTEQYEMARIAEMRQLPVVNVIDSPHLPEKKSWPPRALLSLGLTLLCIALACGYVLARARWKQWDNTDPAKAFALEITHTLLRRANP